MQINKRIGRIAVIAVSMLTCLALAATAFASDLGTTRVNSNGNCSKAVTIPSGAAPGFYDIEATGQVIVEDDGEYPPASASISASANVVFPGETITVFCSGFAPGTTVVFHLDFVRSAQAFSLAQVTETRTVSTRIRVLDPDLFDRVGRGDGGDTTVVVNNSSSSSSSAAAAAGGGGGETVIVKKIQAAGGGKLVRTGVDALPLAAAAMASLLLGTVLLGAARRRRAASDA
ncbi:MAG: hypothetical protein KY393_04590 [Actinobacteria bacterium]|nr:hypothetical protein [Actinomycetota bacterium]